MHQTPRLLLLSSSSGSQGGGELYWVSLANGLAELGCEVEVALSSHPRMDALSRHFNSDVVVTRLDFQNTYDRPLRAAAALCSGRMVRAIRDFLTARQPDLVHVNKQNLEDGLELLEATRLAKLPLASTVHITRSMQELGAAGGKLRDRIAHRTLRRTRPHLLAISARGAAELTRFSPESADRIHTVINGTSVLKADDRQLLRQQWGVGSGDLALGCIARIEEQKNPLFVVELLQSLPDNIRVVWVGDGRLRGDLETEARRRRVDHRLVIDGWRDDASARLSGFDLFILPSLYEGLPLALLEAMAAGLPCVASDVDGAREAIIDGESGRLCPAGDLPAWTRTLTELLADQPQRVRLGANAQQRHRERFSVQRMARETLAVYEQAIAAHANDDRPAVAAV